MIRRILSLIIALAGSSLGHVAVWAGGTVLFYQAASLSGPGIDIGSIALVLLGLVLLAVSALTVALSSLGVIVVGALHVLVGLTTILSPFQLMGGSRPFIFGLVYDIFGITSPVGMGFAWTVPTGAGLVLGAALLAAGFLARGRTGVPSLVARIITPFVSVIFGVLGILMVLWNGAVVYVKQFQFGSWTVEPAVVFPQLVGVLLVAIALITVRWSSAGAIALGTVVSVWGLVGLLQPNAAMSAVMPLSRELASGLQMWSATAQLLAIGVVVLALGFGARIRGRRRLLAAGPPIVVAPAQVPGPYGPVAT